MKMLKPISTEFVWPRRSLTSVGMADLIDDFDRAFEGFWRPQMAPRESFDPQCDVRETADHYLISFDMPGVKKDDIKIEVQESTLSISGERHFETREQEGEVTLRRERSYGRFARKFTIPATISTDRIEAHYENGVLNVAIPKAEAAKSRTIQVQSGPGGLLSKFLGTKKDAKELKDVKVS